MRERGNGKRQESTDQGIRSVSLECIFCFPKWKFENYSERSIVTCDSRSDRTYNARTKQNDPKQIWQRHTKSYKHQIIHEKNHKSDKKGIPPSPQAFRNSFKNIRSKIKILSQTNTYYIWRPSAKHDYTNSSVWSIVNPISEYFLFDETVSYSLGYHTSQKLWRQGKINWSKKLLDFY